MTIDAQSINHPRLSSCWSSLMIHYHVHQHVASSIHQLAYISNCIDLIIVEHMIYSSISIFFSSASMAQWLVRYGWSQGRRVRILQATHLTVIEKSCTGRYHADETLDGGSLRDKYLLAFFVFNRCIEGQMNWESKMYLCPLFILFFVCHLCFLIFPFLLFFLLYFHWDQHLE